ncbi:hypothetical protein [Paraburkholderia sp. MM5384-R2]|uniref:hypothetical protein n=1 Tax=Paraburkholderia sp. MM5384-R2 TaxID=2723097 RepID=UPI0016096690|nr:hypothetical protein [Paraburkholderia sp. MM5384-R2]MBB5498733.1 DNA-binding transcriptional ArsR family regulator [Paraburkholderia sp. MM5384-R2]
MAIAQHLVACEVGLRPVPPENAETPSLAAVALSSDSINLPWIILRAVHRASRLDGVPARARSVLAALARTVDASNPYGHIYARRELLTERAMQSERTFYRSLQDLEAAGLVERAQQRRYGHAGLFGRAYLHLTERAATILGLVAVAAAPTETNDAPPEDSVSADPVRTFPHRSATLADGGIYKDLSPTAFQKRQPGHVPADLQRLRPLGFQKFLIFKLMREAREQGKRLSDVVEATWEHLKKADRPICYLQALLRSTADFEFQIRSRNAERNAIRAAAEERQTAEALVAQFAGQSFVDTNGERKLVIDADGMSLSVYSVEEGVARREAGAWQARFAKALRAGQIRVATAADLEAFAQTRRQMSAPIWTAADVPRVATAAVTDHLALLRGALSRFAPARTRVV